jgi:hypothetical protein
MRNVCSDNYQKRKKEKSGVEGNAYEGARTHIPFLLTFCGNSQELRSGLGLVNVTESITGLNAM